MVIVACLLLIVLLALLAATVYFANKLIEDSAAEIPDTVRWLLRKCGDYWWAPPAAWVVILVAITLLLNVTAGVALTAAACLGLALFCWRAYRSLGSPE